MAASLSRTTPGLFLALVALPAAASDPSCSGLPDMAQYSGPAPALRDCLCGEPVATRLLATLSAPFELAAACDLRWAWPGPPRPIDLRRERVDLDRYTEGWLPFGFVLLRGHAELRGELHYQPGPAGEYWFHPSRDSIAPHGTAFGAQVGTLKLVEPVAGVATPAHLQGAECWTADAVLDVRDIWVLIGGTDEAGAYPAAYRIEAAWDHRGCEAGGE